jgi:ribonuclease D
VHVLAFSGTFGEGMGRGKRRYAVLEACRRDRSRKRRPVWGESASLPASRGRKTGKARAGAPAALFGLSDSYLAFALENLHIVYIDSQEALEEEIARLRREQERGLLREMAIDFEIAMRSRHNHYSDTLRMVQIGLRPRGRRPRQLVIDCRSVDSSPLCALFEDASLRKLIHNAEFEQKWALLYYGVVIENVFDTWPAMRMIQQRLASLSESEREEVLARHGLDWRPDPDSKAKDRFFFNNKLGTLAKQLLGIDLPKEDQLSDWGRERLTKSQVAYAAGDVAILGPLVDRIDALIADLRLEDEVRARLAKQAESVCEHVETMMRQGSYKDEYTRAFGALQRARDVEELDRWWNLLRTIAITSSSYHRLKRLYLKRRKELSGRAQGLGLAREARAGASR